jgi:hypothetical protein
VLGQKSCFIIYAPLCAIIMSLCDEFPAIVSRASIITILAPLTCTTAAGRVRGVYHPTTGRISRREVPVGRRGRGFRVVWRT